MVPLPRPSTNLWGKKIRMSSLDTSYCQFANTSEDKFYDQRTLIQLIWYTQVNNQQKKYWTKNLMEVLYQENQSIKEDKYKHPTFTLATTILKSVGKQILMPSLDTAYIKVSTTTKGKFRDQFILIWSMRTNRSAIKNAKMPTKTLKNNIWRMINRGYYYNLLRLNYSSSIK